MSTSQNVNIIYKRDGEGEDEVMCGPNGRMMMSMGKSMVVF